MKKKDVAVCSFECVDFTEIKAPLIVVYYSPEDYKGLWVSRVFDMDKPTNVILMRNDLEDIRKDIMKNMPNMNRFDRGAEDAECIVEVWI